MNQKSDPTCSHDDRKESIEFDKSAPSTTVISDKQILEADATRSNNHATLPVYCKDVDSIVFVPDKKRVEHQTIDEIGYNKIQKLDENMIRQVIDPVVDDTKSNSVHLNGCNNNSISELEKQISESDHAQSKSNNQEQLMEHGNDGHIIKESKSKNVIAGSLKQDNNKIRVIEKKVEPQMDKESKKDEASSFDLLDIKNIESSLKDDTRKAMVLYYSPEMVPICNEVMLSVIKLLDKQIVEPQNNNKIGTNKSETINDTISSVLDELDNRVFEPRPYDKRSGHQNMIVTENKVETFTPKAIRTLSNMEVVKANQTLQQHRETPSMLLHSRATQLRILSNLPSPMSINIVPSQPQSLFLQALSKLNESSISFAVSSLNKRPDSSMSRAIFVPNRPKSPELTPPASLGSAPPSYSFVLRQMAVRRRPRMFGTFVPSPSFIQHPPPPTYTASFDIYLDNLPPPPPPHVYNFGFAPMLVVCPDCGFTGMTQITTKITLCTHLCAFTLCIMCCWVCVPLPYVMRSCKDVHHYCRNCRSFLGTYCPTNPDNANIR